MFPHRVRTTPWLAGTLESAGTPVANRRIRVVALDAQSATCEGKSIDRTTNEFGKFALPPTQHTAWRLNMMTHRRFRWNLCVETEAGWVPVSSTRGFIGSRRYSARSSRKRRISPLFAEQPAHRTTRNPTSYSGCAYPERQLR